MNTKLDMTGSERGSTRNYTRYWNLIMLTNGWLTSVLENEAHKIPWDTDIQIDHPILARRLDLVLINNKKGTYHWVELVVPADYW